MYPFWRNETGEPRSSRNTYGSPILENGQFVNDTTIRQVTYTDWMTQNGPVSHTVTLLVTPRVVVGCAVQEIVYLTDIFDHYFRKLPKVISIAQL